MSSMAARAMAKMRREESKGIEPAEAWNLALKTYPAESKSHRGYIYAEFSDDSHARFVLFDIYGRSYGQVLTSNSSKFEAWKVVRGIHAYCESCGDELWCHSDGSVQPKYSFELPDREVKLCNSCQRNLVIRALTGE